MESKKMKAQTPQKSDGPTGERVSSEAVCPSKKHLLYQIQKAAEERPAPAQYDFETALKLFESGNAPEHWRSLQELVGTKEFQEQLHREFPKGASEWLDPVTRRGFLKLMSASLALAGLTGCVKQPLEPIVPYVKQPEQLVLGVPLYYATAMTMRGYGSPLLVKSHEGRPTKVDGNPQHPVSMGGSDIFSQASILGLYDPDRTENTMYQGTIKTWPSFISAMRANVVTKTIAPDRVRILTQTVSSPTLAWQLDGFLKSFPGSKWYQWDPINRDNVVKGAQLAFGQYVETQYKLTDADIIVSLDANFLAAQYPGFTKYAREFASRRRPEKQPEVERPLTTVNYTPLPSGPISRFYAIESTPTNTGAKADHRFKSKFADVEKWTGILAAKLGINAGSSTAENHDVEVFLNAVVKDLQSHRGNCVIIPGDEQPPTVHALAHAMNETLGNVGRTVFYTDPVMANPTDQLAGLKELNADMWDGKVDLILIVGGNPVFDTPIDLNFVGGLQKVPISVYQGLYVNETASICDWIVAGTHYLEEWSDARSIDGMATIVQPLIAPLYGGKSAHELLNVFTDMPERSSFDTVRAYWRTQFRGLDFEGWWRRSVHDGYITDTVYQPKNVKVRTDAVANAAQSAARQSSQGTQGGMELIFRADPSVFDGRFANNGWLQELAKPMTKVVWDNVLMVAPETAAKLKFNQDNVVELDNGGQKLDVAIWIQPGHPEDSMTLFVGYGRQRAGRVGTGMGTNAYLIRTSENPWVVQGIKPRNTGKNYQLITTQGFQGMLGRDVVRSTDLAEYRRDPFFAQEEVNAPSAGDTLYYNYDYTGYAWGMAIDQNSCVGCNACVMACQAENNIAVVGKMECSRGRYMHWLRVDTYYAESLSNPKVFFQPVPCMQCENAPCELVCPVNATVHDSEGINDMVYNRCVGTRYCSNNCPYKVRRFNFMLYQDWNIPQYNMMRNPDVSVRSRGVMEKCTYCIQRIQHARIHAEEKQKLIADGSVQTACQQACPADAIVFGNINDKNARVVTLKENPRNYGLLADLNTRPRTTYLAVVKNPNPEIAEKS